MARSTPATDRRMDFKTLKSRHRKERDGYAQALSLRVHRALSWLDAAERTDDLDTRFILLWIAFNAAYALEFDADRPLHEQRMFRDYLRRVTELDDRQQLYGIIWSEFSSSIRLLLDNRYVFRPFWDHQTGKLTASQWETQFTAAKAKAHRALGRGETRLVLKEVFSRLYTLRNQIVHGGATWKSGVNREQLRDGVRILERLVPAIIGIMMDHPQESWGAPAYPVVE